MYQAHNVFAWKACKQAFILSPNLKAYELKPKNATWNHNHVAIMSSVYLCNIVDPEEGVSDEQGLHSPKLMCSLNMPRAIEGPRRVSSHHVIECLQSLRLLCSLGVLQSQECQHAPMQNSTTCTLLQNLHSHLSRGAGHV